VAIALVIGGGLGNLIDRIVHDGRVVDFMQVGFPWLRTGVFNVADMAIMTGVGLMLLTTVRSRQEQ
jgi:signal peptidase II